MALERMMDPPMLDTTGQSIVNKLDQIKSAVQPTNACLDIDISIPASGWSSSAPYTYTYSNSHISSGCSVKVNFLEGAQSTNVLYLEFEKVVNGVRFTSATKPTTAIPVRLHILNADATSAMATTADEVSTSAVSGSANVEDALGTLNEQIGTLIPQFNAGAVWSGHPYSFIVYSNYVILIFIRVDDSNFGIHILYGTTLYTVGKVGTPTYTAIIEDGYFKVTNTTGTDVYTIKFRR